MKILAFILNIMLVPSLLADDLNSVFSEGGNLTDEQVTQSKDFVHQGIKDKVYTEGCKDINNCQVENDNGIEQVIGKVYATALPALLSQFKGSDSKSAKSSSNKASTNQNQSSTNNSASSNATPGTGDAGTANADSTKAAEKKEDGTDWCMIGAMGYEMFSMLLQEKLQGKASKTDQEIPDTQLRTLVNLRETHKARKKSATYQATAYGAVTACYVGMIATGNLSMGWQTGVKMGGAALLTTLYMKKASKHDKLAGKVQKVIDALPKTGACNPWTQSSCFCEEATSKDLYPAEYQEVCVLNGGDFDTPKMAMGCAASDATGKVTYDEQCNCKKTNTCLSARISAFTPTLSGATNAMRQMSAGFDLLDSGLYDQAKLNSYSTKSAAMGSKLARQITNPDSKPIALTKEQKDLAKELSGIVAPELAAQIATAKPDYPENSISSTEGSASSGLLSATEKKTEGLQAKAVKGKYKSNGSSSNSSDDEPGFTMPTLGGNKPAASNIEVVNFADKAINNADVSNAPQTPIFDIISNRYRHAWKRLDEKAQSVE